MSDEQRGMARFWAQPEGTGPFLRSAASLAPHVRRVHIVGDRGEGIPHPGLPRARRELLERRHRRGWNKGQPDEGQTEGPGK